MRRKGGPKARKDVKENIQQRKAQSLLWHFFPSCLNCPLGVQEIAQTGWISQKVKAFPHPETSFAFSLLRGSTGMVFLEELSFYMRWRRREQVVCSVLARKQQYPIFSHNYALLELLTPLDLF